MEKDKIIELVGVYIFQRENKILSDINLSVSQGEFIYIIGKVGTGKTSLIKTLNAEIPLLAGSGLVTGFQLENLKQKEVYLLRRKIGVVFQDFRLLTDRNVFDNLAFVLKATGWKDKNKIEKRIFEVIENVGMESKITKMPHQLSGGEQQRVVIARAILNDPLLLLADEPTGNLDPETSEQILDLFIRLNEAGKTVIMATHDYASIAHKPARTLICAKGRLEDSDANKINIDFESLLDLNK
jgi:cell division transport system ATP-binding protein